MAGKDYLFFGGEVLSGKVTKGQSIVLWIDSGLFLKKEIFEVNFMDYTKIQESEVVISIQAKDEFEEDFLFNSIEDGSSILIEDK